MKYREIPVNVDWQKLITLLRRTFKRGDGGLPKAAGMYPSQVSRSSNKLKMRNWTNCVRVWNIAVQRMTQEQIDDCILPDKDLPEGREHG